MADPRIKRDRPVQLATQARALAVPGTGKPIVDRLRGTLRLYEDSFDPPTVSALCEWSIAAKRTPRAGPGGHPATLLYDLMGTRLDLERPEGAAQLEALRQVGPLAGFAGDALEFLVQRYHRPERPGTRRLAGADVFYNGHAAEAVLSFFPMLQAMGVGRASALVNARSGNGAVLAALERQAQATGGALFRPKNLESGPVFAGGAPVQRPNAPLDTGKLHALAESHDWLAQGAFALIRAEEGNDGTTPLEAIFAAAEQAEAQGRILCVDKGGPAIAELQARPDLRPTFERWVREGTLRFIVHNTDDVADLGALASEAYLLDFAGSDVKAEEARFIGEQYANMAPAELERWARTRLEDVPVFIVGYGNLGRPIGQAFSRIHPGAHVTVVDKEPSAREKALSDEMASVRAPGKPADARPARALIIVATNGEGLDPETVHQYGVDNLVIGVSSGGKGVALKALRQAAEHEAVVAERVGASTEYFGQTLPDRELILRDPDSGLLTRVRVVVDAQPLNLFAESSQPRFVLTFAGLAASAAELAAADKPGWHKLPPDVDADLLALYRKHMLHEQQPVVPGISDALNQSYVEKK